MLNFTKGKWVAENWDKDYWAVFGNTHTVADCFGNEDNARLIAAAPELYELVMDELRGEVGGILSFERESKIKAVLNRIDGEENNV